MIKFEKSGVVETYTGSTVNFKERHKAHMKSVTNTKLNSTTLSSYMRSLNSDGIPYTTTWGAKEHTAPYNPATGWCRLCTLEKYHILFDRVNASLNQRSEFFCPCFHKKDASLWPDDCIYVLYETLIIVKLYLSLLSFFISKRERELTL